ncbi:DUF748 domain-containing protein [Uliginosibacterium aquaticum]|uniref:DUF748 domain-containing protein n=1 Tax=Uliginosibacterium aquaticum TaxID=2731212 RepID=A0ABX2IGW3_9RHOO|nr:DUF748 domain-containing protein [Uliginosibacterium aquaticum]NSL55123.1 DUF748 domain-containing protein [Uliginosibacterium aquaticum]
MITREKLLAFVPRLRQLAARRSVKIAAASVLGLLVLAWLGMPPLLRWALETQGSAALGRKLSVERVSFNPLRLSARLEGLRIAEADGQSDFVALAAVQANVSTASLWHRALVLDALRVEQPRLKLVRLEAQRFNFSDILERFAKPSAEPAPDAARFSLNNIELEGGEIEFDDRPLGKQHHVRALALGLPFLSNLPARVENFVKPRLAFDLEESSFELLGELKPFADRRVATLDVDIEDLDLTAYLAYVPVKLPVRIEQAHFGSALRLHWEEALGDKPAALAVSGRFGLKDLKIKEHTGADLLAVQSLQVELERVEPLASQPLLHVRALNVEAPQIELLREKDRRFRLERLVGEFAVPAGKAKSDLSAKRALPRVLIDKLSVSHGRLNWHDEAVPGGFALKLDPFEVQLSQFDLGTSKPASFTLQAASEKSLRIDLQAQLNVLAETYSGRFAFAGMQLEPLRPYYQAALPRALFKGETALAGEFSVAPGKAGPAVRLDKMALDLRDFSLADAAAKPDKAGQRSILLKVPQTRAEEMRMDLELRELHIGRFSNRGLQALLQRDADGVLNLADMFQSHSNADSKARKVLKDRLERAAEAVLEAAPAAEPEQPWQFSVGRAEINEGGVRIEDRSSSVPVVVDVRELGLSLQDWSSRRNAQAKASLSARINRNGRMNADAAFSTEPLRGRVNLDLSAVELLPAQAYLEDQFRVLLTRGTLTAKGKLDFDLAKSQPDIRFAGALAVDDFNMLDRVNEEDFLRWRRLALQDMSVQTEPLGFSSREIRLSDFYTRLILDAQGRLNLREITAHEAAQMAAAPQAAPSAAASAVKKPLPRVRVERIVLEKGQVRFSDRFVKPNYDANLLALNGSLGGLSSDESSVALLDLGASLDGSAPVKLYGSLNPFRQDGFLDIQAQVRDVDLTSASTYAGRYVGYGIDKGKLSMDVQYQIRDRQLTAKNSVKLDQLSFGDKVDSPDATKLPVLFAVSLLKDRNGMIDINLPISGSLDDPEFSVGGVIIRVISNLIGKAVTAPFALLGSIFGEEAEALAWVDFEPGSATLNKAASDKLGGLAKGLTSRPVLKLEIAGSADPASDTTGLKRARLDARVRALKAEQLVRRGDSVDQVDALQIEAAEYPALLKRVYESEKIDARPRNALGILKDQSPAEMERILQGSFAITPADLQTLARTRAQTVRAHLLEKNGVDPARVFLVANREAEEGKPLQARVEFMLR